jgi:hypothetical protein
MGKSRRERREGMEDWRKLLVEGLCWMIILDQLVRIILPKCRIDGEAPEIQPIH